MKVHLIALLLLTIACSRQGNVSKTDGGKNVVLSDTVALPSDPLTVKEAALNSDERFLPPGVDLPEKLDKITKGDSYQLIRYKACTFTIVDDKKCNGYRHLLISKERDRGQVYLEPYKALYLAIINPENKIVATEMLEESSVIMLTTSVTGKTHWNITPDSILTVHSTSSFCSDVIVEGGDPDCWTDKVTRQLKLTCDGIRFLKENKERVKINE